LCQIFLNLEFHAIQKYPFEKKVKNKYYPKYKLKGDDLTKYKKSQKVMLETWRCEECLFEWAFRTLRCPICRSENMIKTTG